MSRAHVLVASAVLAVGACHAAGACAEPTDPDSSFTDSGLAKEKDRLGWAVPDSVRLQTGGFLGMFTVAVGYSAIRDAVNVQVSYGFVPKKNGVDPTHVVTGLLYARPLRFAFGPEGRFLTYPLYIGAGLMGAFGPNTFVQQPPQYPPDYYPPTALHGVALLGTELAMRSNAGTPFIRHSLFAEFVTLDQYLDALNQNREVTLLNAFSTALGYRASF